MHSDTQEIRKRLGVFAAKWSVYDGTEKSGAQEFLNDLLGCYGQSIHAGDEKGPRFEDQKEGKFRDLYWPGVCIIEMKAPKETPRLTKHRKQLLDYWRNSADPEAGVPTPEFAVLCSFRKIEVWQPGKFPTDPRLTLDLIELEERPEVLAFLAGEEPTFAGGRAELTRDAVTKLAELYQNVRERKAAPPLAMRDFVLQCVWCMFAEDLGQLPGNLFSRIVGDLIASEGKRSSADDLGGLFEVLNKPGKERPTAGIYAGARYVNGGLFSVPAHLHLHQHELELLRDAAKCDWGQVEPSIFGSLLEAGLGHDNQWKFGAHYTHVADIQKIVQPTIVQPWTERIESIETLEQAAEAQNDLLNYVVLDPACGSGNFLYVAYREIKRLERRLHEVEAALRVEAGLKPQQQAMSYYPLKNIKGIEVEPFAVALARVTLWMGHKLAVDELDLNEPTLPLGDLSGIRQADALVVEWPRADAIIGNPPFHGSQNVRGVLGDEYVEWLKKEFGIGIKDLCVYWFRKAYDRLEPGKRAGLVGTNSISQNRARSESLEYIVDNGGVITDAVSTQVWPGEAKVHVSIANWIKEPYEPVTRFMLDGVEVEGITTSLREGMDSIAPVKLGANKGRCYQGPIPAGDGFVLTRDEARHLMSGDEPLYRAVIRPYVVGDDITSDVNQSPTRFIIDFAYMSLEEARQFPAAIEHVERTVKPVRAKNNREAYRKYWWRFAEARRGMRDALDGLNRYIVGTATGKRTLFTWVDALTCPSNATNVFAFEDDFAIGVLTSMAHSEWARARSSTLKGDIRYTPTTAFATFPWPQPNDAQREAIATASRAVYALRSELCRQRQIGLTKLYNQLDEGAFQDLRELHKSLDEAVAAAYGWPKSIAQNPEETNARLLALNLAIDAGDVEYRPFDYLDAEESKNEPR